MMKQVDRREATPIEHDTAGLPPDEMPRARLSRRQIIALAIFVVVAIALLYGLLPRIAGLKDTWNRLEEGDPWWLVAAFFLECLSFGCYVALFRAVFTVGRDGSRIAWRESYQITLAGLAASRLLAAGGAGGVVLTAWALRRSGMERREVAARMTAFLVLLYAVYMLALLIGSLGLRLGIFPGPAPFGLTVPPAIFAGLALIGGLAMALVPRDLDTRVAQAVSPSSRRARVLRWLAAVPATVGSGVRGALILIRRNDPRLLGAIGWWAFDIGVLWACLHAFGASPTIPVIVTAYYVGMLANVLPLPGGIGGVDGGMIAALIAFGIDDGQAIVAVLSYRVFAFWLPTIPGAIAYLQLVRTVQQWRTEPDAAAQPARALP
jgi:uncharacterized membrane protein YbhN (UPF0104 family)